MNIKYCYKSEIRKTFSPPSSYEDLLMDIKTIFQDRVPMDFIIQYKDKDGDMITISSDTEYKSMVKFDLPNSITSHKIFILPSPRVSTERTRSKSLSSTGRSPNGSFEVIEANQSAQEGHISEFSLTFEEEKMKDKDKSMSSNSSNSSTIIETQNIEPKQEEIRSPKSERSVYTNNNVLDQIEEPQQNVSLPLSKSDESSDESRESMPKEEMEKEEMETSLDKVLDNMDLAGDKDEKDEVSQSSEDSEVKETVSPVRSLKAQVAWELAERMCRQMSIPKSFESSFEDEAGYLPRTNLDNINLQDSNQLSMRRIEADTARKNRAAHFIQNVYRLHQIRKDMAAQLIQNVFRENRQRRNLAAQLIQKVFRERKERREQERQEQERQEQLELTRHSEIMRRIHERIRDRASELLQRALEVRKQLQSCMDEKFDNKSLSDRSPSVRRPMEMKRPWENDEMSQTESCPDLQECSFGKGEAREMERTPTEIEKAFELPRTPPGMRLGSEMDRTPTDIEPKEQFYQSFNDEEKYYEESSVESSTPVENRRPWHTEPNDTQEYEDSKNISITEKEFKRDAETQNPNWYKESIYESFEKCPYCTGGCEYCDIPLERSTEEEHQVEWSSSKMNEPKIIITNHMMEDIPILNYEVLPISSSRFFFSESSDDIGTVYRTICIKNTGTRTWNKCYLQAIGSVMGNTMELYQIEVDQIVHVTLKMMGIYRSVEYVSQWELIHEDEDGMRELIGQPFEFSFIVELKNREEDTCMKKEEMQITDDCMDNDCMDKEEIEEKTEQEQYAFDSFPSLVQSPAAKVMDDCSWKNYGIEMPKLYDYRVKINTNMDLVFSEASTGYTMAYQTVYIHNTGSKEWHKCYVKSVGAVDGELVELYNVEVDEIVPVTLEFPRITKFVNYTSQWRLFHENEFGMIEAIGDPFEFDFMIETEDTEKDAFEENEPHPIFENYLPLNARDEEDEQDDEPDNYQEEFEDYYEEECRQENEDEEMEEDEEHEEDGENEEEEEQEREEEQEDMQCEEANKGTQADEDEEEIEDIWEKYLKSRKEMMQKVEKLKKLFPYDDIDNLTEFIRNRPGWEMNDLLMGYLAMRRNY